MEVEGDGKDDPRGANDCSEIGRTVSSLFGSRIKGVILRIYRLVLRIND